jgi:WD40 repeat protein/serine/threonine protein kinase
MTDEPIGGTGAMPDETAPTADAGNLPWPPERAPPTPPTPRGSDGAGDGGHRRGDRIGPYVLLDPIGAGAYGSVWRAEQREPVRRTVALKILHAGMNSAQVVARFRAEQQALAMMDHPGIARVFDAGLTPSGLPYFAMQYVKGDTLLKYCDRERLPLNARLQLFTQICDAVHHAHIKGVVHRDLKPSNIVVTTDDDGSPQPVVIDFGVAKALLQPLTQDTVYSVHGGPQGTWAYMSPEQAEGIADIDTRTDIYSLGVVLYELLSGARPFDDETLERAGEEGKRKLIREVEPPAPGARVEGDTTGTGTKSAHSRQTSVRELARTLTGELSWIPLYAMRKDRRRRYDSASQFAVDIRNYLEGKPLIAAPESVGYRVGKFVRRNVVVVAAVASVIAALSVGMGTALWQRGVAIEQTERAGAKTAEADREREIAKAAAATAEIERNRATTEAKRAESEAAEANRARDAVERNAYVADVQMADAALDLRRFDLARQRIDTCPQRLRGWEWAWLETRADRSLVQFRGHTGLVWSAAFSPDGSRVVTASRDNTARVWDATTGATVAELKGHTGEVRSAAFSPDGSRVVTASRDNTARVWDAATGATVAELRGHTARVTSAAFSPDGSRVVTASRDKTARVWDAATGAAVAEIRGHTGPVTSAAFSPDGSRVVTASRDNTARVWDAATGAPVAELRGHTGEVTSAAFSPDGSRVVTASRDKTARVWDATNGATVAELRGHTSFVASAAFSPDGSRVVTASEDTTARVWDAATGATVAELRGHTNLVASAAFSPDGSRVVTASLDTTARVWDAATGATVAELRGHTDLVASAAFSPDGLRVVTASYDTTARIRDCIPHRIRVAERQANARGEDGSLIVRKWIEENLAPGFGKPPSVRADRPANAP